MRRVRSQFLQSLRGGVRVCLMAICLLALSASAASAATPGVLNYFGSTALNAPTTGGEFGGAGLAAGVAVNDATGDVYVADTKNHRVQRFSASGQFISTWGFDVNLPAASPANTAAFEICTVALNCKIGRNNIAASATRGTGGEFSSPAGIAVDQATGNVYVRDVNFNRIQVFTSTGTFVRAFGQDVVFGSGGQNAPAQPAIQQLTVDATAGQYKLSFQGQTTGDIAFDAPAATVQAALEGLSSIGAGNVTVGDGPGGTAPYTITFAGELVNSPQPTIATGAGTTPLSGGAGTATATTTQTGSTGFEVCTVASTCKTGVEGETAGAFSFSPGYLAVAPVGAPNAGNVLTADRGRVQEFTSAGVFVRAFGRDVVSAGPGNTGTGFEVCKASTFDVCKLGEEGSGSGEFTSVNRVAEDKSGNIYTVERPANTNVGNFRVQKFTLPGNAITPQGAFDPAELSGANSNPFLGDVDSLSDVAVDDAGFVYVVKAFPEGTGVPPVVVPNAAAAGSGRPSFSDRILKVDPAGNGGTGQVVDVMLANPGEFRPPYVGPSGLAVGAAGKPLYAATATGTGGFAGVFRLGDVPPVGVTTPVMSDIKAASVTLSATVTPSPIPLSTFYHFEYSKNGVTWERAPDADVDLGNGSGSGDPNSCPIGNPATCNVSVRLSDLAVGVTYQVRVVTETAYRGASFISPVGFFFTEPTAPDAFTQSASWSGGPDSEPTLSLRGRLNPQGNSTSYRFEYVTQEQFDASGYDEAVAVPAAGASAGHGVSDRSVEQIIAGLDPTISYHYRLVATNAEGTAVGVDRSVAPPSATDRFLELVTNGDGQGVGVRTGRLSITDDGQRVLFEAQTFGEQESAPGIVNPFIAQRGDDGWSVVASRPGVDVAGASFSDNYQQTADLTKQLWAAPSVLELTRGELQWTFSDLDGNTAPAGPRLTPIDRLGSPETYDFAGGSTDLSTFVFRGPSGGGTGGVTLLPGEQPVVGNNSNLYEIAGAATESPTLRIVNRASDGSQIGGACGARLGAIPTDFFGSTSTSTPAAARAVSDDGSVVYFSARAGSSSGVCDEISPVRIFKRVNGASTVAVSESQCTRTISDPGGACAAGFSPADTYQGASADGSKVFFTTSRQLLGSATELGDSDTTADMYMYDSSPPAGQPNLVQVSAGEVVAGDHPTVGSGANVIGVADVSADGSRVYFVATGRLTAAATQGANNLYVYQRDADHPTGRIAFVAALSNAPYVSSNGEGDADLWTQIGNIAGRWVYALPFYDGLGGSRSLGDGRYLVFGSMAPLVAEDGDTVDDVYRYDDEAGELVCLSCVGDGNNRVWLWGRAASSSPADYVQSHRIASEDVSSVVFSTDEPLIAADDNFAYDVYEWHDGELRLVSGATGDTGVAAGDVGFGGPSITPDGESVFFQTRATLLPGDTNNSGYDWYVARVGGGFDLPTVPVGCDALAGSCQGTGTDAVPTERDTTRPSDGNAVVERPRLSVAALGAQARKRAARSGVLPLRVRASSAGTVRVSAKGRIGKRTRKLGSASKRLAAPGLTTVELRLNRAARRALGEGRRLSVSVVVSSGEARPRSLTVVLRRAGK